MLVSGANPRLPQIAGAMLLALSGCTAYQHQPDAASLLETPDCGIVNGSYTVRSEHDGAALAAAIFQAEESLMALDIQKADTGIVFVGETSADGSLTRSIPERFACNGRVLTVVLADAASGDGLIGTAADTKLEAYATEMNTLHLRFIDSALTFVFILPYYSSSDSEIVMDRAR